jgi:thiamine-monophosphate kinase
VTEPSGQKVGDLGESGLIERIADRIGSGRLGLGIGDDTAVVPVGTERVLMTTDELAEGLDFDFSYCAPADVGWKAIAVNASDIAAMCGEPLWATVSVGVPPETDVSRVDGIVDGMSEAAARWDIGIVGGDTSRATDISLSVNMIGSLVGAAPVTRSGARLGDALCVTGSLGGAAAGLRLLRYRDAGKSRSEDHPSGRSHDTDEVMGALVARQLRPQARVEQAAVLASLGPSSMIDLSDGLAVDLAHLMDASGTGCVIDPAAIPLDPGLASLFGTEREPAIELAMVGGEDFELLFTLDPDRVPAAVDAVQGTGVGCTRLGTVMQGDALIGDKPLSAWKGLGWDHLHTR